ncbi:MAG TPA: tetratricopeptide repeat-containing sensor histidine kinase [Sediminibacterium sp.]|nr:tetratricopeptide repeat-containing sensor histidine kinase [Sediminibacterium sp.]
MLPNTRFRPSLPVWIAIFLAIFGSSFAQKPGTMHPAPDTTGFAFLYYQANERIFDHPDSAIFFANRLLERASNHPSVIIPVIKSKIVIARAHYVLSNYNASLEYSEDVMQLSEQYQYQPGIVYALRNRGLIYLTQEKVPEALVELKKSEALSIKIKDSASLASIYFNIGICFETEKVMDKAKAYFTQSRDIGIRIKDWHMYLMAQNRLAETYYNTGEYEKAIKGFNEVLQFSLYSDNWEKSYAYSGLGQTYLALKQYPQAIQNGLSSLSVSSGMKAGWDMHRATALLADAYAASGDFRNAYLYEVKLNLLTDTIYNQEKEKEINYLILKEKKIENQKLYNENQLQLQRNKLNRLIIIVISVVIMFLIVLVILTKIHSRKVDHLNQELLKKNADIAAQKDEILKQKEALTASNSTKDMLFSIISHDLRSPFAVIQSSLALLKQGILSKEDYQEMLEKFEVKVGLISGMLNNLLAWANSQQKGIRGIPEKINLPELVDENLKLSVIGANAKMQQLKHNRTVANTFVTADPNQIRIIFQNLIGNAIKFTPNGGTIEVFYSDHSQYTALHVKDHGIGMDQKKIDNLFKVIGNKISEAGTNKEKGTGIGLMIIKQLIQDNEGYMEVKSELGKGSEFIVYFKK